MIPGCAVPQKPLFRVSAAKALAMLGLTSVLCLDIGDSACSDLSAQQVSDLSGSGNHFNRGSTSGADATDPSLNGTANLRSSGEYLGFDGGDFLTPAGAVTFDDAWHHDNAKVTLVALFYTATSAVARCIFGNSNSATAQGVQLNITSGNVSGFQVKNGSGNAANLTSTAIVLSAWNFIAWSIDEAAGANGSFVRVNRTVTLKDATYSSPGSSNANDAPQIGARGGTTTTQILSSGDRLAILIAVSANWSAGQVAALHVLMQGRFPGI